ncbi:tRNA-binding protein [Robertkochia aurantiaca]|uniref:tRNA-binding protein n=1 Tax=Robertkochia aurantiaca TaxID=2873700 RepID=UPI001CC94E0F|nr:tRNA-binding protein [Robertkochia sp. 3YJGBD-33]
MEQIAWGDFLKVDIRAGTVIRAENFERAQKPAYKLWIDFGESIGTLRSSAQITDLYRVDELVGRQVVAAVNLGEKQIANFISQCLVLGVPGINGVVLLKPDSEVRNGDRIA